MIKLNIACCVSSRSKKSTRLKKSKLVKLEVIKQGVKRRIVSNLFSVSTFSYQDALTKLRGEAPDSLAGKDCLTSRKESLSLSSSQDWTEQLAINYYRRTSRSKIKYSAEEDDNLRTRTRRKISRCTLTHILTQQDRKLPPNSSRSEQKEGSTTKPKRLLIKNSFHLSDRNRISKESIVIGNTRKSQDRTES